MLPLPPEAVVDPRIGSSGPCLLALEDGTVFRGVAFGAPVQAGGDLVVNTSQTGYQEVCTDPSYAGQVVVMTFPLIGNHGRFADDDQSERPWLRGLVVAHATAGVLGRARQIVHLLRAAGVPAVAGLDTRQLARHLRSSGSLRGVITAPGDEEVDARRRRRSGRASMGGPGLRLAGLGGGALRGRGPRAGRGRRGPGPQDEHHPLAPSPWRPRARAAPHRERQPGPGGRRGGRGPLAGTGRPGRGSKGPVALARAVIADGRPLLGICLGHQIVARAAGAQTRSACASATTPPTTPCATRDRAACTVTAQNHEVEVVAESLPAASGFYVSQRNLNDGSVEGLRHHALPIETVQYHPEGSPGPLDAAEVFDRFLGHVRARAPHGSP